jgi:pimeloyl-ACP methyl ester carboxylesterase
MPATRSGARTSLRQMGHRRSLRARAISSEMIDWVRAWQRDTGTMANDAAMIVACGTRAGGFDPRLDLTADELARVGAPCHLVVGTADIVGGGDTAQQLADLLPHATAEVWEGAGHLPWLDDPACFGATASSFLRPAPDRKGRGHPHRGRRRSGV